MKNRYAALRDLVEFKLPQSEVRQRLACFDWDFDDPPQVLQKSHIINAISLYLNGEVSDKQLEGWAEVIQLRDDIEFDPDFSDLVSEVVHALGNPLLEGEITQKRCMAILSKLR